MLQRTKTTAIRLWKDEGGASLLEYSLLIGIIVAVTVGVITAVGVWVTGQWTTLKTALGIP
jgi:Flp pilus assembly pilin Flp